LIKSLFKDVNRMRLALLASFAVTAWAATGASQAAEWRVQRIDTPARVMAI